MKATSNFIFFIIYFVFVSCPVLGQVSTKKYLTEADYSRWSKVEIQSVSKKGDWVSYAIIYESGTDTLAVRNKTATKTYTFAKGTAGKFGNDSYFVCMMPEKELCVLDLKTGNSTRLSQVKQFDFSSDGMALVVLNEKNELRIEHFGTKTVEVIEHVSGYYLNAASNAIVYTIDKERASLHYCLLNGKKESFEKLSSDSEATFENIAWQEKGLAFAFVKKYRNNADGRNGKNLYLYRIADKKLFEMGFTSVAKSTETIMNPQITNRFVISDDVTKVIFFATEVSNAPIEKPIVQVWNGNDAWTYSQIRTEIYNKPLRCLSWMPESGQLLQLSDSEYTKVMFNGTEEYAITYSATGSEPQFDFYSRTDFYATSLKTGNKKQILNNQSCGINDVSPSYGGKYLMYRNNNQWFVYEFATDSHKIISSTIPVPIYDTMNDRAGMKPMFGIAGWTSNDAAVIIYDEYDLWLVAMNDLKAKRLTHGRENQIVFRLAFPYGQSKVITNVDGFMNPLISLEKGFYLKATGKMSKQSGYFFWDEKERPVVYTDKLVTELGFTGSSETLYYKEEDFDSTPKIIAFGKRFKKPTLVFDSNSHHKDYHWGYSKLISYKNSKGEKLQGALFYPANYDATKQYPMVVYIYEKLSHHVHYYVNPSLYNGGVLNISSLNSRGYFVLYPDITYEMDQVGDSAKDCVESATKAVIAMGIVTPNKIALFGHSFGGYEVNFIATQSDLFATIISGAGVSDLLSSYLSIGWNNGRPEIWRYEYDMWRMSKSLYAGMDHYLKNSPLMFAQNVKVPMLIWTGEQDKQVHYFQSIEFYNALRRLGKKQVMLIYPENRHRLTTPKSQIDFTHRYEQWLDTFLKDLPAADWISNGIK